MNKPVFNNWQSVQREVLRRIHARHWAPGALIPTEAELAAEFGCARVTVNRALRAIAETGLLDRKRKAGTRVALQPAARATLTIPVIRGEVEARGQKYGYQRLARQMAVPPAPISGAMRTPVDQPLLQVGALHLADDAAYALEDRWINTQVVPDAAAEAFETTSCNEWLLSHAPYTHGEIAFSAHPATAAQAKTLGCPPGSALFVMDRLTWDHANAITKVRLLFPPGHQLRTGL